MSRAPDAPQKAQSPNSLEGSKSKAESTISGTCRIPECIMLLEAIHGV